jgi:OOP family OmpA-OmpF porin
MRLHAAVAVTLALAGSLADAEQRVGDTYVVPQLGYGWPDNDRNADDDVVAGIALGKHFSEAVSLELGLSQGRYDLPVGARLDLTSYSIDALHIFARDSRVSPFMSIGAGALHNDPDRGDGHTHLMGQAGLGLMIQVSEADNGATQFSFRPEVKARWSFPRNNEPQDKFLDYVAVLGFQLAFGDRRPEPVAPAIEAPPAPPPAPPPPPPRKDSDGDGVFDDRDKCPDTPLGVAVDADGCPRRGSATLQGVTFEFDSARLTGESKPVLDEVAADLKKYRRLQVELQGHTDSKGSDAYNLKLSEQRAQSVRDYLLSQGVGSQQLVAEGYGETEPVADNKTEAGRAENRRVVMQVISNPGDVKVDIEAPKD